MSDECAGGQTGVEHIIEKMFENAFPHVPSVCAQADRCDAFRCTLLPEGLVGKLEMRGACFAN